ncbi:kinesin-like nuclear fusion protein [Podila minutissima]|nr:kinesin-like nuclear fusion protein [Podila minutissima]
MENNNSNNLNNSTSAETLNCSISKLRPPRPIMRTNSSSALLTDLANFAAGIAAPTSDNGPKKDNTLTLEMLEPLSPKNTSHLKSNTVANNSSTTVGMAIKAGLKRKAEVNAISTHTRTNPAAATQGPVRSTLATKANVAPVASIVPSRRFPGQPNPAPPNRNQVRPTSSTSVATKGTTARQPPVTTSIRPTATSGAGGRTTTSASSRPPAHSSAKDPRIRAVGTKNASLTSPATNLSAEPQEKGSTTEGDHSNTRYQILTNLLNQFSLYSKKKRPAWDTKGRLEEMDGLMDAVYQFMYQEARRSQGDDSTENEESQMTAGTNTTNLWGAPRHLKRPARDTKQHVQEASLLIDTMHQKLRGIYKASQELENTEHTDRQQQEYQEASTGRLMVKKSENEALHRQEQALKQQVQGDVRQQSQDVRNLVDIQTKEQEQAQSTESKLQRQKETLGSKLRDVSTEYGAQTSENSRLRSTIVTQSSECLAFDSENRAIKSKIEEATIRYPDFEEREIEIVKDPRAVATLDKGPIAKSAMAPFKSANLTSSSPHADECVFPFQFDHVFQPQSTHEQVYNHIVPTVEHAFAGSPVTIFGYGLPQSDRSFTLEAGLVPLVVQDVCQRCQELEQTQGWQYTVALQQLGIADEVLYDLFTESEAQETAMTMESPKNQDNALLEIQHGKDGTTTVSGLSTIVLNHSSFSMETIVSLLEKASQVRSTVSKSSGCHREEEG